MERLKKLSDDSHHTEYATAIDEAKVEKNAIKLEKHFKRMESGNLSQETYEYIQTLLDKLKEQDSRLWQGFIHFYHDIKVTGHETAITEKIEQIRNAHTDCKDTLKTVMESGFTKAEEDARRCMAFFMKDDPEKFDIYESQLADALEESKKT
ncbi:MAG: hypothetical protein U9O53_04665, partial [archaeon]|nr:hypothetical protein [archaeon]